MITWGSFGIVHMLTFIAAIGMILGLYCLLRRRSERVQTLVWVCCHSPASQRFCSI